MNLLTTTAATIAMEAILLITTTTATSTSTSTTTTTTTIATSTTIPAAALPDESAATPTPFPPLSRTTDPDGDPDPDPGDASAQREAIARLKYVVWGVMGICLAVLGFLGNVLSMVVLQQRQMRSSTSYYLLSLAIYDNGLLLGMLFYFVLPALTAGTDAADLFVAIKVHTIPVGYPISLTAQMGSIYTCVGFTIERFIAVCRPLHVANTCTKSRALRAILLVFAWSVAYNIPRFFHYHIVYAQPPPPPSASPTTTVFRVVDNNASFPDGANSGHPQDTQHPSACVDLLSADEISHLGYNLTPAACAVVTQCGNDDDVPSLSSSSRGSIRSDKVSISFHQDGAAKGGPGHTAVFWEASDAISPFFTSSSYPAGISQISTTPSATSSSSSFFSSSSTSSSSSSMPTPTQNSAPAAGTGTANIPLIHETEFGSNPVFQHIYLIYSYLFFMFLLPFTVILVMNIYLISAVKKSRSTRQSLSTSSSKEQNLTVMLIAVVVVFLVCQFPTIIDNILLAVMGQKRLNRMYIYQVFYIVCSFMVEINSAVNFILYCFFGKKFRVVLLAVLGLKKRRKHVAYRSTVFKSTRSHNGARSYDTEVSTV